MAASSSTAKLAPPADAAPLRLPGALPAASGSLAPSVLDPQKYPTMRAFFDTLKDSDDATHHREPDLKDNLSVSEHTYTPSSAAKIGKGIAAALLGATVVGLPYVFKASVRVEPGQLAVCTDFYGALELYGPGRHFILSPFSSVQTFDMDAPVSAFKQEASGGALFQLINIQTGEIGVALDNNRPVVLNPGKHILRSSGFIFKGAHPMSAPLVTVGDVSIIMVAQDQVGWGHDKGQVHVLKPGRHVIQSPTFVFGGLVAQSQSIINFGAIIFLKVLQNEAYVIHQANGTRAMATQGFYVLEDAAQVTIDSKPIPLNWQEVTFASQVRTQDGVALNVTAAIFLRISDPQRALSAIAHPIDYVVTRAQGVLSNIISESPLTKSGGSVRDLPTDPTQPPSYNFDGNSVHSKFEAALRHEFLDHGIELNSMRVTNWEFRDAATADRMSQASAASANIQVQADNAVRQKNILLVQKDGEAEGIKKLATAEADALRIRSVAEAEALSLVYETVLRRTDNKALAEQVVQAKLMENVLNGTTVYFGVGASGLGTAALTNLVTGGPAQLAAAVTRASAA